MVPLSSARVETTRLADHSQAMRDSTDTFTGTRPDPLAPNVIRLRQATQASFRAVVGDMSVILRVDSGTKLLAVQGCEPVVVPEGALALLPADVPIDVENRPAKAGLYRSTALLLPGDIVAPRGAATRGYCTDLRALAAFARAIELHHQTTPPALQLHALQEVLLWLDAAGLRLPPAQGATVEARIRALIGSEIDRDWRAAEVASHLAMSEATLRRRLAEVGTTLTNLLVDQRMMCALGMLQSTELPVGRVAAEVGYASASRFAVRFRARFGLAPHAIRVGAVDRYGTKSDRTGRTAIAAAE